MLVLPTVEEPSSHPPGTTIVSVTYVGHNPRTRQDELADNWECELADKEGSKTKQTARKTQKSEAEVPTAGAATAGAATAGAATAAAATAAAATQPPASPGWKRRPLGNPNPTLTLTLPP